jgi:hypothetical protein
MSGSARPVIWFATMGRPLRPGSTGETHSPGPHDQAIEPLLDLACLFAGVVPLDRQGALDGTWKHHGRGEDISIGDEGDESATGREGRSESFKPGPVGLDKLNSDYPFNLGCINVDVGEAAEYEGVPEPELVEPAPPGGLPYRVCSAGQWLPLPAALSLSRPFSKDFTKLQTRRRRIVPGSCGIART